jgi:septal ring factor EnvC (AmiA/AmiB activator)
LLVAQRRPRAPRVRPLLAALVSSLAFAAVTLVLALHPRGATGASLNTLSQELNAQQSRQHSLGASLAHLRGVTAALQGQIAFVRNREADVQAQLRQERAQLASTTAALGRERAHLAALRARLQRARTLLAHQLVSGYENPEPGLVQVVLNAGGFSQLLDQLNFLSDAENQQQRLISLISQARAQAQALAARLATMQASQRRAALAAAQRAAALAGMNALLSSRQTALAHAQAARQAALAAAQARGRALQADIARVQAEQAAAAQAAASAPAAPTGSSATPTASGPALGPSGGWAIPYPIVLCESGGQNLSPNSAGASGYYQILPSTWSEYGGSGPAAYLASKAEQDAVAARIWNGGAGAGAWVCARMLGYVR